MFLQKKPNLSNPKTNLQMNADENILWEHTRDKQVTKSMSEILRFLRSEFGGSVAHSETIALMFILKEYRIQLMNGLVINDPKNVNLEVWLSDAAVLASLLCQNPKKDMAWWKGEYYLFPTETKEHGELIERLMNQLRQSDCVVGIERV